jgi:hypothetical protein
VSLFNEIIKVYPELELSDFAPNGKITLRNDSDDQGDYIAKWEYSKPVPKELIKYIR